MIYLYCIKYLYELNSFTQHKIKYHTYEILAHGTQNTIKKHNNNPLGPELAFSIYDYYINRFYSHPMPSSHTRFGWD